MTDLLSVITKYLPFLESCVFLNTSKGQSSFKIVQDQTIYIYIHIYIKKNVKTWIFDKCSQEQESINRLAICVLILNVIKLEIGNVPFSD